MAFSIKKARAWLCAVSSAAALVAAGALVGAAQPAQASGGVQVFVGYADNLRANPAKFPTPWDGSPGVIFEGCSPSSSCTFDGGAARVVNNSGSAVTLNSIVLHFSTCTYDIWPHNVTVPTGKQLIVAQTTSGADSGCTPGNGHMDSSDIGPNGAQWAGNCSQSGVIPQVDVTIDGTNNTFNDSGKVLNTGGVDAAECPPVNGNESTQWTLIGNQPCPGAVLSLTPPSQTHQVGDTATVTANLSCGTTPLQGASVKFDVTSGPNAGTTGTGTTNASGDASFSYSSLKVGTDAVQASVSNPAGTITSNTVQVIWTAPFAPGGGAFVIGDLNSSIGTHVTFWSARWSHFNQLSGGRAPRSFKGFAKQPTVPTCGVTWTSRPGNSSHPPHGPLPAFMAIIVSSKVTQRGHKISGDILHIVVVKTNPGYRPSPGHRGTGTVVSQVC